MICIRKEQFECVQFTKENRDEILQTLEPYLNGKNIFIKYDDIRCAIEKLGYGIYYYFYNDWYIFDWDESTWKSYTDEEFKAMFEIVEGCDKNNIFR